MVITTDKTLIDTTNLFLSCHRKGMDAYKLRCAVLKKIVPVAAWQYRALLAGWCPPIGWYREERDKIQSAMANLISTGVFGIATDWTLHKRPGYDSYH